MSRMFYGRRIARPARCHLVSCRCEALEARRLFAAGDLDPSFGGDGEASVDVAAGVTGGDVAVQADGKTVVVGGIHFAGGFAVTRYNLNGTPDTTFGPNHDGTVLTRFEESAALDVAIQPDGKIVVVGTAESATRVVRYNPDGALDRSFGGGDGVSAFDPAGIFETVTFNSVLIQPDGKILLGGSLTYGVFDPDWDLALTRLNPDGSYDSGFGDDGTRVLDFGDDEFFGGMAIDYSGTSATNPDYGKIVVAAARYTEDRNDSAVVVTRLTTGGDQDMTYDGDGSGLVRHPDIRRMDVSGVVIQEDGRVVVGGTAGGGDFMLVRFERGGPLDTTFGTRGTGWVTTHLGGGDEATDLMTLPSGGLVLVGLSEYGVIGGTNTANAVAFYTAGGLVDNRFGGGDGQFTYAGGDRASLAAGPGRRFVIAGGPDMRAIRYLDVGANLVYAAALNPTASENGPTARGFFVYRVERVPYATRVYFNVGGTATAPFFRNRNIDYSADGMAFPIQIPGEPPAIPYAEIPANQTFTSVIITPNDDALFEGNETAVFTIRPDAAYEVGDPRTVTLVIVDNDSPPPSVAEVYVRGSSWKGTDGDDTHVAFKEYLASAGIGDHEFGYRVDNLHASATLPWTNLNQIVLRYSFPPTGSGIPGAGGVTLDGVRYDYGVVAVEQVDPRTFVLTLDRPLGAPGGSPGGRGSNGDRVTLSVPGGAAGGTYTVGLRPLSGDADQIGGRVTAADYGFARSRLSRSATRTAPPGGAAYTPFADLDGSGAVTVLDLVGVRGRFSDTLPVAAAGATPDSAPVLRDRRSRPHVRSPLQALLA